MRGRVVRCRVDGGAELADGAIEVAGIEEALTGIGGEESGLTAGLTLGDLGADAAFAHGGFAIAELAENGGKRGMRASEIGLEANGLAQRVSSFRKLAFLLEHGAKGVVGFGVIRANTNGGAEFVRSGTEIALLPERDTKGVVGVGLIGIQLDGFLKFGNGGWKLVFQLEGQAEIVVQSGVLRRNLETRPRRLPCPRFFEAANRGCSGRRGDRA